MIKQTKLIFLIVFLIIILIALIVVRILTQESKQISPNPSPTPAPFYKTIPLDSEELPEQIDPEIYTIKTWMNHLPLATKRYYIDAKIEYMATDSAVLATIYTKEGDEQAIKNEVLGKLKDIGVDLSKEKILWQLK